MVLTEVIEVYMYKAAAIADATVTDYLGWIIFLSQIMLISIELCQLQLNLYWIQYVTIIAFIMGALALALLCVEAQGNLCISHLLDQSEASFTNNLLRGGIPEGCTPP